MHHGAWNVSRALDYDAWIIVPRAPSLPSHWASRHKCRYVATVPC